VSGCQLAAVDWTAMEPSGIRGDGLIVQAGVDRASLQVEDAIQYRRGNLPIGPRIMAIEPGDAGLMFTTQGANMDTADSPITADQIDGKVVFGSPAWAT